MKNDRLKQQKANQEVEIEKLKKNLKAQSSEEVIRKY